MAVYIYIYKSMLQLRIQHVASLLPILSCLVRKESHQTLSHKQRIIPYDPYDDNLIPLVLKGHFLLPPATLRAEPDVA